LSFAILHRLGQQAACVIVRHGAPQFFIEGVDVRRGIACRQTPDHFDPEAVVAEQLIAKANDSCLPTSNSALGCHPHLQAHVQHWANRAARARAGTDTLVEGHEQSVDIQPILTGSSVSSAAFGYGLTSSPMRLIALWIAKPCFVRSWLLLPVRALLIGSTSDPV